MYFFCLNNINMKYTFSAIQQVEVYLKYILKYTLSILKVYFKYILEVYFQYI